MSNFLFKTAVEIVQSPKTTAITAGVTTANGVATYFNWMGENIGVISSTLGALSVIILTIIQIKRSREKSSMHDLHMRIAKHDFEIRLARIHSEIDESEI